MGRADDVRSRYDAELAVIEAEERLIAAKAKKSTSPDDLRQIKDEVRAARQSYREGLTGDASATAQPAKATAAAKSLGKGR